MCSVRRVSAGPCSSLAASAPCSAATVADGVAGLKGRRARARLSRSSSSAWMRGSSSGSAPTALCIDATSASAAAV